MIDRQQARRDARRPVHVEEIPPGFTHVLLMRDGAVVAQGLLSEVLTSATLSTTFGQPLVLDRIAGRYFARRA